MMHSRRRQFQALVLPILAIIALGASPSRPLSLPLFRNINNNNNNNIAARSNNINNSNIINSNNINSNNNVIPFGPVLRGGSLEDIQVYNYKWSRRRIHHRTDHHHHNLSNIVIPRGCSSASTAAVTSSSTGVGGGPLSSAWGNVRGASRVIRRRVINFAIRTTAGNGTNGNTATAAPATGGGGFMNIHLGRQQQQQQQQQRTSSSTSTSVHQQQRRWNKQSKKQSQRQELPLSAMGRVFFRSKGIEVGAIIEDSSATSSAAASNMNADAFMSTSSTPISTTTAAAATTSTTTSIARGGASYESLKRRRSSGSSSSSTATTNTASRRISSNEEGESTVAASASAAAAAVAVPPLTTTTSSTEWVIETPLFPIILPKSWEPSSCASSSGTITTSSTAAAATTTTTTTTTLEISVAMEQISSSSTPTSTSTTAAIQKPPLHLLQAATQPLIPKTLWDSFTGNEFYYPESMESLALTGLKMARNEEKDNNGNVGSGCGVVWTSEKKTAKFMQEFGGSGGGGLNQDGATNNVDGSDDDVDGIGNVMMMRKRTDNNKWYQALDSTQEVLVWAGKFSNDNNNHHQGGAVGCSPNDGYGGDLPIIKTTSIIHKSPKYLAELLMDSNKVQVYNKLSLGRTDEEVFQEGVDTVGGSFGDGESKVVRNLTKPPMVNSIIEFVTCMHARKLRQEDVKILSPNSNDPIEGYIVVSRAVTGGKWNANNNNNNNVSSNGEKLVRNEILLGVNVLKAVPGEPNKTELTAVSHVYSSMIPLMLAKNAGVKGAVDFVRDVRALP